MDQLKRNPHWSVVHLRMSLLFIVLKLFLATMLAEVDFMVLEVDVVVVIVLVDVVGTMVIVVVVVELTLLNSEMNMVVEIMVNLARVKL